MSAFAYTRPKLFRENLSTQHERSVREKRELAEKHALKVVRSISDWFDLQRELGTEFEESDLLVQATSQCRRHGVSAEFIPGAQTIIRDIYFRRSE